jgi:dolichyl-phosphate beta-glucosyltransferase
MISASIVIPVYNGSAMLKEQLPPFLSWLRQRPYQTEIILVDDGSDDRDLTASYARAWNLLFLQLPSNQGKGEALRRGFQLATGDIQLFTDADIPFQYENIDDLISLLGRNPHLLAIGDRTDPRSVYREKTSRLRNWGSNMVSTLVNLFFTRDIKDTQCGLKGMGKEVAHQLFSRSHIRRFAIDIELIHLALTLGIPIEKLPVQLRYNDSSTVHAAKDGIRLLYDIYRIRKTHGRHSTP